MMLLIKISLLFSLLLPDSGKWQRIQTPECISFLFPNTPCLLYTSDAADD